MNMTWKDELRRLKLEHIKRTSPGFYELSGGERQKLKVYSDTTSNGLTTCVYDWLKYHNHWVNKVSCTGLARKINGKLIYTKGSSNMGTADLSAIIDGRIVMIEIKCATTHDRLSKYQVAEKGRIEASGGTYLTVSTMQEFVDFYKEFVSNKTLNENAEALQTIK